MQAFLEALVNNTASYLLILLFSGCLLALLVRASTTALYDPWALQQIQTAFATSAVILMWQAGIINSSLAIYHISATIAFLVCAGSAFKRITLKQYFHRRVKRGALNSMTVMLLIIFVLAQLSAWMLAGIPILLESRLNAFSSGGGIGVLSRIISFTSVSVIFLSVLRIGTSPKNKIKFLDGFVLIFSVFASVANGSKTSILLTVLIILMSNWIFQRTFLGYVAPTVSKKKLVAFACGLSVLVLIPMAFEMTRDSESAIGGPLSALALRLVFSGDGYMWLYGDDYLSFVKVSSPIALLFSDFLGVTRIVPWDQLPVHPGLQIYQDLYPFSDAIRGPNVRVDAFGLLFGNMLIGVIFSAALGSLFGVLRAWLFRVKSAAFFLPAIYLFIQAPALFVDPLLGVTALVNAGFGTAIVVLTVVLIGKDPFGTGVLCIRRNDRNLADAPPAPTRPLCEQKS